MILCLKMEQDKIRRKRLALALRVAALLVIAIGMLLSCITFFEVREQFDLVTAGLIVYSWLPYLVCLLLAVGKRNPFIPLFGAMLPLILDFVTHVILFIDINFASSQAAIWLLLMPALNLILFMPLGLLIGFLFSLLFKRYKYL